MGNESTQSALLCQRYCIFRLHHNKASKQELPLNLKSFLNCHSTTSETMRPAARGAPRASSEGQKKPIHSNLIPEAYKNIVVM